MDAQPQEPPEERSVLCGTPEEIIRTLRAYEQAGVETLVLDMHTGDVAKIDDRLEHFAQDVMPACIA